MSDPFTSKKYIRLKKLSKSEAIALGKRMGFNGRWGEQMEGYYDPEDYPERSRLPSEKKCPRGRVGPIVSVIHGRLFGPHVSGCIETNKKYAWIRQDKYWEATT